MPRASKSTIVSVDDTVSNTESESDTYHHNEDALSTVTSNGDSSFYGEHQLKKKYELRARNIDTDVEKLWRVHDWNLQVLATRAVEREPGRWPLRVVKENEKDSGQPKRKRGDDSVVTDDMKPQNLTYRDHSEKRRKIDHETEKENTDPQAMNPQSTTPTDSPTLYNPYEGAPEALQLNEPISSFISRLKPSTDQPTPWIFCANFHSSSSNPRTFPDIASFKQVGGRLLDKMRQKRRNLEDSFGPPKDEGAITRMMKSDRETLESEIMDAAKRYRLMSGKWMLFPPREKVDKYWSSVVQGTVDGRLGTSAKVATRPEKEKDGAETQVICVYTRDITDRADIKRVLLELVRLGLAPAVVETDHKVKTKKGFVKGQIWYKPDCYTWLDITSGNEYRIRPTLYGTAALLTGGDLQRMGKEVCRGEQR